MVLHTLQPESRQYLEGQGTSSHNCPYTELEVSETRRRGYNWFVTPVLGTKWVTSGLWVARNEGMDPYCCPSITHNGCFHVLFHPAP